MPIQKDPFQLLKHNRFDIAAKHIYARHREKGVESDWHKKLYIEHIKVLNGGFEINPKKDNINDFLSHFNNLLDSIKEKGYDQKNLLPITNEDYLVEGAHRLTACLLYNIKPFCNISNEKVYNLSSDFFKNRKRYIPTGLMTKWLDPIAVEYAKLKKNTYLIMIFPSALGKETEIKKILSEYGNIVYKKEINLRKYGKINFIRNIYPNEWWLGSWKNGYMGAKKKADWCFKKDGPTGIYLYESDDAAKIKVAKEKLRDLFSLDKTTNKQKKLARSSAVHINDTHEETVKLSQLLFNENGIHFLNNSKPAYFKKFEKNLKTFKNWVKKNNLDIDDFCIVSSSCLSLYGIRDANDIDFIYFKQLNPIKEKGLGNHNEEIDNYPEKKDEIIFNPQNHFFYKGIKFASIDIIKNMKLKRGEIKDKIDLKLIEDFIEKGVSVIRTNKYSLIQLIMGSKTFQKINYILNKSHRLAEHILGNARK